MIKLTSLVILASTIFGLLLYHVVYPYNGDFDYRNNSGLLLRWSRPFQSCTIDTFGDRVPGRTPFLGTDKNGKDLAYRVSVGLGRNFWLALTSSVVFLFFAIIFGVMIGFEQRDISKSFYQIMKQNNGIRQVIVELDILQSIARIIVQTLHAIPLLLLLLVIVVIANKIFEDPLLRMLVIMVGIGILSLPKLALLIKDRIRLLDDEEFIAAARASGLSDINIITKHILWYDCGPIIAGQVIYVFVQSIMLETVISFLGYGLGIGIDRITIGGLINQFKNDLPGSYSGDLLALLPLTILMLVAITGNGFTNIFMGSRYER